MVAVQSNTDFVDLGESVEKKFECEACRNNKFNEFPYPIGWEKRYKIEKGRYSFRAIFLNNAKYIIKKIIFQLPDLNINAFDLFKNKLSHLQWKSSDDLKKIEANLKYGAEIFSGRSIRVCQNCGFGSVFPALSEKILNEYYSDVYWLAQSEALENCVNPRTEIIYKMMAEYIPFDEDIKDTIEFGSASAQLSRYLKKQHSHIQNSVIEKGENWYNLLQAHVKEYFYGISEVDKIYDIFLSSHSLEHVPDFTEYFKNIVSIVKNDGYLIFEVPNSVEAEVIFNLNSGDYHIPHTYFFTEDAFKEIAKRFGLTVLALKTFNRSYSQILNNIHNGINGAMENPDGAYLRVLLKKC